MDDQGRIRHVPAGEALLPGEVEVSAEMATELASLSPKARREFHKCRRQGYSEDFSVSAALSIDGVRVER
jgi:hypothetical protein